MIRLKSSLIAAVAGLSLGGWCVVGTAQEEPLPEVEADAAIEVEAEEPLDASAESEAELEAIEEAPPAAEANVEGDLTRPDEAPDRDAVRPEIGQPPGADLDEVIEEEPAPERPAPSVRPEVPPVADPDVVIEAQPAPVVVPRGPAVEYDERIDTRDVVPRGEIRRRADIRAEPRYAPRVPIDGREAIPPAYTDARAFFEPEGTAVNEGRAALGVTIGSWNGTVVLKSVVPDSPADLAGLRPGDQLVRLNGQQYGSPQDYALILGRMAAGDLVQLEILRDNQLLTARPVLEPWNVAFDPNDDERVLAAEPLPRETIVLRPDLREMSEEQLLEEMNAIQQEIQTLQRRLDDLRERQAFLE